MKASPETCRLGASQPPGRSLEPRSNARPRGMTVLREQSRGQNSAYRSGCHNILEPHIFYKIRSPNYVCTQSSAGDSPASYP